MRCSCRGAFSGERGPARKRGKAGRGETCHGQNMAAAGGEAEAEQGMGVEDGKA